MRSTPKTTKLTKPPERQVDVYLTNKLHGVVPGAVVIVKRTGERDQKYPDRWARQWILEIPGQEDTVLGNYLNAAKEAVKMYRQKIMAEQFVEKTDAAC